AAVGFDGPGEQVEQRALAAAVGADDADDLGLLDVERHVVDRVDAAEGAGQVGDFQNTHREASVFTRSWRARPRYWRIRRIRRARRPRLTRPSGRNSTISITMAPTMMMYAVVSP